MQLTKNFTLEELTGGKPISEIQRDMLDNIAVSILQPIRDLLGVPCIVACGLRVIDDYSRLIKQGLHPSETSDHYYGYPVPLNNVDKVRIFGPYYTYSVGAVDFVPKMNITAAFTKIVEQVKSGKIYVGQLIHESGGGREWIHVSNPRSDYVASSIIYNYFSGEKHLLSSVDGGKTYQEVV